MSTQTFGNIVRDARAKKNFTLAELSSKTGYAESYLSDIEHGHRKPNISNTIYALAKALDIHEDVLYFAIGKLPPDLRKLNVSQEQIIEAFQAFREVMR
jgi:transcriptional regulator with XRE-family HTH domain